MSVSPVIAALSEAEFQDMIITRAKAQGWLVHHDRRQDIGIAGDTGYPDLTLAKNGVVLFIEVKTMDGKTTPGQTAWVKALGPQAFIARPSDWHAIEIMIDSHGERKTMIECICGHEWDNHELIGEACNEPDCLCASFEMVGEEVPAI